MKRILLLCGVIAVALASTALGQSEGQTVIHACKHPSGGWLRRSPMGRSAAGARRP